MPKKADNVTRLHLSIFNSQYKELQELSKLLKRPISELIRIQIETLIKNKPFILAQLNGFEEEKIEKIEKERNLMKPHSFNITL